MVDLLTCTQLTWSVNLCVLIIPNLMLLFENIIILILLRIQRVINSRLTNKAIILIVIKEFGGEFSILSIYLCWGSLKGEQNATKSSDLCFD